MNERIFIDISPLIHFTLFAQAVIISAPKFYQEIHEDFMVSHRSTYRQNGWDLEGTLTETFRCRLRHGFCEPIVNATSNHYHDVRLGRQSNNFTAHMTQMFLK